MSECLLNRAIQEGKTISIIVPTVPGGITIYTGPLQEIQGHLSIAGARLVCPESPCVNTKNGLPVRIPSFCESKALTEQIKASLSK